VERHLQQPVLGAGGPAGVEEYLHRQAEYRNDLEKGARPD
jgi:hypothetical protein